MAYTTYVVSESTQTLVINDYTGTPVPLTIGNYVPGSLQPPQVDAVEMTEVPGSGSTGKTRYANPVHGLKLGLAFSFQIYMDDINNDTDKNPLSLFRGLAKNSVAATGHSGETYTNQLTGGGKLMAKLLVTERDTNAAANVTTLPFSVDTVVPGVANGVKVATINCLLAGTPTFS